MVIHLKLSKLLWNSISFVMLTLQKLGTVSNIYKVNNIIWLISITQVGQLKPHVNLGFLPVFFFHI